MTIVLSVFPRSTASDYPFSIFKLFLTVAEKVVWLLMVKKISTLLWRHFQLCQLISLRTILLMKYQGKAINLSQVTSKFYHMMLYQVHLVTDTSGRSCRNCDDSIPILWTSNDFVCPFVLFLLAIVLYVLLPYTDSDYPFGIFKLFL